MYRIIIDLQNRLHPSRRDPTGELGGLTVEFKDDQCQADGGGLYRFGFKNIPPDRQNPKVVDFYFTPRVDDAPPQPWTHATQDQAGHHTYPFWVSGWQDFQINDSPDGHERSSVDDYWYLLVVEYDAPGGRARMLVDPEIHNSQPSEES